MFTPFELATIESIIQAGKSLDISHEKLHSKTTFKANNDKIIANYASILDKYQGHISKFVVEVELSDEEYAKYQFQPKLFSLDHYGTTELWSHILRLNNLTSITQFTKRKLKIYTEDIFDLISEIFILEEDAITDNRIAVYGK